MASILKPLEVTLFPLYLIIFSNLHQTTIYASLAPSNALWLNLVHSVILSEALLFQCYV